MYVLYLHNISYLLPTYLGTCRYGSMWWNGDGRWNWIQRLQRQSALGLASCPIHPIPTHPIARSNPIVSDRGTVLVPTARRPTGVLGTSRGAQSSDSRADFRSSSAESRPRPPSKSSATPTRRLRARLHQPKDLLRPHDRATCRLLTVPRRTPGTRRTSKSSRGEPLPPPLRPLSKLMRCGANPRSEERACLASNPRDPIWPLADHPRPPQQQIQERVL